MRLLRDIAACDSRIAPLHDRFVAIMFAEHVLCFGEGDCSLKRTERDLRLVQEYIEIVQKFQR